MLFMLLFINLTKAYVWKGSFRHDFQGSSSVTTGESTLEMIPATFIQCATLRTSLDKTYCFKDFQCFLLEFSALLSSTVVIDPITCFVGNEALVTTDRELCSSFDKIPTHFFSEECKNLCDLTSSCERVELLPEGGKVVCRSVTRKYLQNNYETKNFYCKGVPECLEQCQLQAKDLQYSSVKKLIKKELN